MEVVVEGLKANYRMRRGVAHQDGWLQTESIRVMEAYSSGFGEEVSQPLSETIKLLRQLMAQMPKESRGGARLRLSVSDEGGMASVDIVYDR